MIPPNQQIRQAMAMRQMMSQHSQVDPLLQALSQQKMMGEMMTHTADYKLKMYKLKQKYAQQGGQPPAVQPQAPQGAGGYQ